MTAIGTFLTSLVHSNDIDTLQGHVALLEDCTKHLNAKILKITKLHNTNVPALPLPTIVDSNTSATKMLLLETTIECRLKSPFSKYVNFRYTSTILRF